MKTNIPIFHHSICEAKRTRIDKPFTILPLWRDRNSRDVCFALCKSKKKAVSKFRTAFSHFAKRQKKDKNYLFLCLIPFFCFLYLCFLIFLRRFLTTLPIKIQPPIKFRPFYTYRKEIVNVYFLTTAIEGKRVALVFTNIGLHNIYYQT